MILPRIGRAGRYRAIGLCVLSLTMLAVHVPRAMAQGATTQIIDSDTSAYHRALLAYKDGKFKEAWEYLDHARNAIAPEDAERTAILESKILIELKRYDEAEKVLRPLLTEAGPLEIDLALGDVLLRKRSFERATKYYGFALKAKSGDPDITLKLVYARIGADDLVGAGQYSSTLKPMDVKNPYDAHASYYFAKAALAQSAGDSTEAEKEIQDARTNYGITVTNRYLKTYLEFFAPSDKSPSSELTPPPRVKP